MRKTKNSLMISRAPSASGTVVRRRPPGGRSTGVPTQPSDPQHSTHRPAEPGQPRGTLRLRRLQQPHHPAVSVNADRHDAT